MAPTCSTPATSACGTTSNGSAGGVPYEHRVLANCMAPTCPCRSTARPGDRVRARPLARAVLPHGRTRSARGAEVTVSELLAQHDPDLKEVADFVYRNVFSYYSEKQWGIPASQVDDRIIGRRPVRLSNGRPLFHGLVPGHPRARLHCVLRKPARPREHLGVPGHGGGERLRACVRIARRARAALCHQGERSRLRRPDRLHGPARRAVPLSLRAPAVPKPGLRGSRPSSASACCRAGR